jgi:hypothetical protein
MAEALSPTKEESGAMSCHAATPSEGPQLMLLKTELQTWLGKKYCDEAELLHLLLAHTVVRRWRTINVEFQPLGGDSFEMKLGDGALLQTSGYSCARDENRGRTAESERLEQEKQHAIAAANQRRSICIENTPQKFEYVAGVYELSKISMSGHGMWQLIGGEYAANMRPTLVYYTVEQKWGVSNKVMGLDWRMSVASTALTPDQITETWQVSDGTAWVDAPNMKVRVCGAGEKCAAERLEQERQQVMAAARGARDIFIEGQQQGDHQHVLMGLYELVEEVNRRAVWQMAGGQEFFMHYTSTKQWWLSTREHMEAGEAAGFMCVDSFALTPDQITETWQVGPTSHGGKGWLDVPKVGARVWTMEEKRAALTSWQQQHLSERLEQEQQQQHLPVGKDMVPVATSFGVAGSSFGNDMVRHNLEDDFSMTTEKKQLLLGNILALKNSSGLLQEKVAAAKVELSRLPDTIARTAHHMPDDNIMLERLQTMVRFLHELSVGFLSISHFQSCIRTQFTSRTNDVKRFEILLTTDRATMQAFNGQLRKLNSRLGDLGTGDPKTKLATGR